MAVSAVSTSIVCSCCLLVLAVLGFADCQRPDCTYYEEGRYQSLYCGTSQAEFTTFGPRLLVNGTFQETGSCDINGTCSVTDPARFSVRLLEDTSTEPTRRNVTVTVDSVDRTVTRLQCFRDDLPVAGAECNMKVYVRASKPRCDGPEFVNGNTSVLYSCTSERVYPGGDCTFQEMNGLISGSLAQDLFMKVAETETDSAQFPGDQEITCRLLIKLSGIPEGVYSFRVAVLPELPGLPETAVSYGDVMSPLNLRPVALYRHSDNNRSFDYPASGELRVTIHATGNPPPVHFSLRLRHDETSTHVSLSSGDYSVTYSAHPGGVGGEITMLVTGGLDMGKQSYFIFEADNGVLGSSAFEYNFSVMRVYAKPSKPICSGPNFVYEGNTALLISCTATEVYPTGKCAFTLTAGNSSILQNVELTTTHSSAGSGHMMSVTCKLRVPVTGSVEGDYRFQVEITPDAADIPPSATTVGDPLNTVSLKPITLFNPDENGHTFNYPQSGELSLVVHVTGNPEPTRRSLRVRHDETFDVVLIPNRDYQWEYDRTVAALRLSISGGLQKTGSSTYTLKVDNGIVGDREFGYTFSVLGQSQGDAEQQVDESDDNTALIVGIVVGSVVFIVILVALVIVVVRRGRRQPQGSSANENFDSPAHSGGYIYPNVAFYAEFGGNRAGAPPVPPPYETSTDTRKPETSTNVYSLPTD